NIHKNSAWKMMPPVGCCSAAESEGEGNVGKRNEAGQMMAPQAADGGGSCKMNFNRRNFVLS
ncbi:MAG: hypothetical protein K2O45_16730, partial [Oscillospiraceae bacterium]|nr:hypothetical protein [Oscillospiraceae bacterium]